MAAAVLSAVATVIVTIVKGGAAAWPAVVSAAAGLTAVLAAGLSAVAAVFVAISVAAVNGTGLAAVLSAGAAGLLAELLQS